ncbi:MAG: energy-coupling factor transporter ATPase [Erysipelotrichaceae bacterium]
MNVIEVKNLSFNYDNTKTILDDISFDIKKNDYVTIIGHNGSGKSTIAKLLIGILEKKKGTIKIGGLELIDKNIDEIRQLIGIVFQNPDNQFIGSTVKEDIAFGLENRQVPTSEMQPIIDKYAKLVNMTDFLDSEPTKLSGGQKQRVAIATVLAMNPEILIFDEAYAMLDPLGKKDIIALINQLHEEQNKTVISITHDMDEVANSDFTIVLNDGKIVMADKPEVVLQNVDLLKSIRLDTCFSYKVSEQLNINKQYKMEGLVDELCQLILKK